MNRSVTTMAIAFGATFLVASAIYWEFADPAWLAGQSGSAGHASVRLQALYVLIVWLAFAGVAWWLRRRATRPLQRLQADLQRIDPGNPLQRISHQPETPELDGVVDSINALLGRVHDELGRLDHFTAQVAHELRLPLTLARLRLDKAAPQLPEALVEDLVAEFERLSRFVDQTLLLAKAEQGNLPLQRGRMDLHALLGPVVEGIALMAEAQGRSLEMESESAWIDFDPDYTKQIVYNLLANALRHGTGTIRVRLRSRSGKVRLLVVNPVRAVPSRRGSLGSGQRIVAALAALHRGMRVRYRCFGRLHVARLVIAAAES
ncbi:HAMP domain-containing sensor histidine kinase [Dokdonella soli]|uniref:histidine kinase n=1 Tax=Dokdonella soli TaxID=529810 RepID=A0ABN1IBH6_9GAMM